MFRDLPRRRSLAIHERMQTFSLQSGSNGNSIYVEAGETRLLFDAGISGDQAENRMKKHHRRIRDVQALIISHDHWDHTRGAGVFHRKFGIPVYMTERVYRALRDKIGKLKEVRRFLPGEKLCFGDVAVQTIPTPHDGIDSVCFMVEHTGRRLGILTDLGCPFLGLAEALEQVDAAYLESNYDPEMLRNGPYSDQLKRRIMGGRGHISNEEAAELAARCIGRRMKWLAAAHLSEQNNRPQLALEATQRRVGKMLDVQVASRYDVGPVMEV